MPNFTASDGAILHYETQGEGADALIYLHGMGGSAKAWGGFWRHLVRPGVRHVALDFRGHGGSRNGPGLATYGRTVDDVIQLADTIGAARCAVVGYSFGGKVGLSLAARVPQRVTALILLGSVGPGTVPFDRGAVAEMLPRLADVAFVRDYFRSWFPACPEPEFEAWTMQFAATPVESHRAVCELALWTDLSAEIGPLSTPALIVAGEHDPAYGPEYQRRAVWPTVPKATLATIDCGHGMFLERPREIALECDRFLNSLAGR